MYSKNFKNKNVCQQALLFAPSDIAEQSVWVKALSPEELASLLPKNS